MSVCGAPGRLKVRHYSILLGSGWRFRKVLALHFLLISFFSSFLDAYMNLRSGWKAATGKLSLYQVSLPGLACRWKSHPLLCASTHSATPTPALTICKGGVCHFTIRVCHVWYDVTKRQIVDGHFTLLCNTPCEWESVCFCFVCVVLMLFMSTVCGRGPHEVTHSAGVT